MKIVVRIILVLTFGLVLTGVIAYARGYRPDFQKKTFSSTGIIAVSAYPRASKIYINGELKGVTDYNITLPSGHYQVEVKKEGYTGWKKNITLKGELVETLDILLFPINPSLTPLTNLGISKAVPIGLTDRLLIFSDNDSVEKDGIYVFEPGRKTISFLPPLKLIIAKTNLPADLEFKDITTSFSPDFKQVIIDFGNSYSYLLSLDEENITDPFDVTNSKIALLDAWHTERQLEIVKILETFPKEVRKIATDSFNIISFSPDKNKVLYVSSAEATLPSAITPPLIASNQTQQTRTLIKDQLYVYDKKEDKNFHIQIPPNQLPDTDSITDSENPTVIGNDINWFPDSQHLVLNEKIRIAVIDYDNTNKQIVYSGPFDPSFIAVTGDGKLLVLTNFNTRINNLPDVYAVGIR